MSRTFSFPAPSAPAALAAPCGTASRVSDWGGASRRRPSAGSAPRGAPPFGMGRRLAAPPFGWGGASGRHPSDRGGASRGATLWIGAAPCSAALQHIGWVGASGVTYSGLDGAAPGGAAPRAFGSGGFRM
ncbi:hypothetical protein DFJ73DRAFT_780032 [Zopfochytrium polystomum]|nr:hypothetical protein DFJ73DRAFT_780032 [Zopfochytrium polystomum]